MAEFIEILRKNSKVQNDTSQTNKKYKKKSFSTHSKISQNALIPCEVFKQAINIMGDTIEDMDVEIQRKN